MKKVGIYGATGYTGAELVKLLTRHPQAELTFATSETHAGEILSTVIHDAPNISLVDFLLARVSAKRQKHGLFSEYHSVLDHRWREKELSRLDNNLFGQPSVPVGSMVILY